jgi:methionine-rich copper-binding protein CopC
LPILLLAAVALLLLGASCDDTPTGGNDDTTPPSVVLTTPAAGESDVAVTTAITITFSEKIDTASVTSSSLNLDHGATASYSFSDNTVTMIPIAELTAGTVYTVTVGSAIRDRAGNRMVRDSVFTFTTEVDPNALPPTILATTPADNATGVAVDAVVTATFSKGMDTASLNAAITLDHSVSGTVSLNGNVAVFTPSTDLAYDTTYTVTISTGAVDTFGLALAAPVSWQFTVQADPATPVVTITSPNFEEIVGDTLNITVDAASFAGIDSVTYFISSFPVGTSTVAPFSFTYVISGLDIAAEFSLSATAYADNQGVTLSGFSPEIDLTYKWQYVGQDNPNPSTYLNELFVRTSDSVVEFRVTYWNNWNQFPYPYDTTIYDSTIGHDTTITIGDDSFAFAMYIDADRNALTGRDYWQNQTTPLNGMGADFRVLVGLFGGDTTLSVYNSSADNFNILLYDTTDLVSHRVYGDTNVFEIGIRWSDLQNSSAINVMVINADFSAGTNNPTFDYFPELGTTTFTILRQNRYLGTPGSAKSPLLRNRNRQEVHPVVTPSEQPFD